MSNMSRMQKSAANRLKHTYAHAAENKYTYAHERVMLPATLPDIESEMYATQDIWFKAIKPAVHVYSEFCA